MSAETALYAALSGAAPVTAIVALRIYPNEIPEEQDVPAIAYERVATEPFNTIHGTTVAETADFEITCVAEDRDVADDLADKAKAALLAATFMFTSRAQLMDGGQGLWGTVLSMRKFTPTT